MSIMELGALGEFVGAFAVVATLIYLAIQIRQNTGMMQVQISQARADLASSTAMSISNSDYLPTIFIKVSRSDELNEEELERFRHWFRGFNRMQDNYLLQHGEGFLGKHLPRDIGRAVRQLVAGSQTGRDEWAESKHAYSDEYVALVDSIITEEAAQP